ncbi:hypothetical protein MPER_10975, partial [Moniliophthora perniciosa FA553]
SGVSVKLHLTGQASDGRNMNALTSSVWPSGAGISGGYGAIESDEERFKVLDAAYASGRTFWDTANIYGDFAEFIGSCLNLSLPYFAEHFEGVRLAKNPEIASQFGIQFRGPQDPNEKAVSATTKLVKAGKVKCSGLSDFKYPPPADLLAKAKSLGVGIIAWSLAQGDDFFVIPGTKKVECVNENIGAADIKLAPEEVGQITQRSDK